MPSDMNATALASTNEVLRGPSPTECEILTVTEVARFLRVPKSTVYKLARLRALPASKVGKHWRFMRRDVQNWIRERAHSAPAR